MDADEMSLSAKQQRVLARMVENPPVMAASVEDALAMLRAGEAARRVALAAELQALNDEGTGAVDSAR